MLLKVVCPQNPFQESSGAPENKFLLALALIAGIVFVVVMVQLKQPPERTAGKAAATPARILEVTPLTVRTEARGYGQVLPARSWKAVVNVGGDITWRHPYLDSGNLISEGTRLLQINPTRYELAVASARADIAGLEAERRQLDQEEQNTRELLELENCRLALAQRELQREKTLADSGSLYQTRLDEKQRTTLQLKMSQLRNVLSQIPGAPDPRKQWRGAPGLYRLPPANAAGSADSVGTFDRRTRQPLAGQADPGYRQP